MFLKDKSMCFQDEWKLQVQDKCNIELFLSPAGWQGRVRIGIAHETYIPANICRILNILL